jgi:hypothetical protein
MGAKIQAFDIFLTPLSSHYSLPLSNEKPLHTVTPQSLRLPLIPPSPKTQSRLLYQFDHFNIL